MAIIVTFADLGARTNLKTADIVPLIDAFRAHGEDPTVLCRFATGDAPTHARGMVPRWLHYIAKVVEYATFGWFSTRVFEERVCDVRASRYISRSDDTVVVVYSLAFPRAIRAAKHSGKKVIGVATTAHLQYNHELDVEEFQHLGASPPPPKTFDAYRDMLDMLDILVALSPFAGATFTDRGFPAERLRIATLDVDTHRFHPHVDALPERPFTVLFPAASIGVLKGLQYLLDIWGDINVSEKRLIILGTIMGWPPEVYRRHQRRIQRDPTIDVVGFVSAPEDYFAQAHVVAFPSFTEGFSRSVAEAMASGVPVITTPAAQGLIEDGVSGFVIPPRDSAALREKLEYLWRHPHVRERMGDAARARICAKRRFGDTLWHLYRELKAS